MYNGREGEKTDIYPGVHTHTHTHTVIDLQTDFYHIGASEDGSIKKRVLKLLKASFV